jgi:hypothetical protein
MISMEARKAAKGRAWEARVELDLEIDRSSATVQQKAFMRQRLAQLWNAVLAMGGIDE